MSRPPCRSSRPIPRPTLERLADQLLSAHLDRPGSSLVRIGSVPTGGALDLALLPLPDDLHPADLLLGDVLPSRWWAAGVIASARAWVDGHDDPSPVAILVLLSRDGHCIHRVEGSGVPLPPEAEPPTGRLVDLLLRSLELPTPPPTDQPDRVWDAMWLDRVAAAALAGDVALGSDDDLAALHPLVGGHRPRPDLPSRPWADDPATAWRTVHRLAAGHGVPTSAVEALVRAAVAEHLSADEVAWMDEGCLARWLASELPPIDDLLDLAGALLSPALAEGLRSVVEGRS